MSHRGLAAILLPNVKFNYGDGIEPKGGLFLGGSRGPEPPSCVSERLKNENLLENPRGLQKFQNELCLWWVEEFQKLYQ